MFTKTGSRRWWGKMGPAAAMLVVAVWSVWGAVKTPGGVPDYGRNGELLVWIMGQTGEKFRICFGSIGRR